MDSTTKYWISIIVSAFVVLLITIAFFLLIYSGLQPDEKQMVQDLQWSLLAYAVTGMGILVFGLGKFVGYLFESYVYPIEKLAEETQLISLSNSNFRIEPGGASEVNYLVEVINELADKHIAIKSDVHNIIKRSKVDIIDEKKRLEALMSQIPSGVLVCNLDGRVLLYNRQALEVTSFDGANGKESSSPIGLGRSIFNVLDRKPIVQSLNYLQNSINKGNESPVFEFITSRYGRQFLKINMAPVIGSPSDDKDITGYILAVDDITGQIQADSRRDIFLQSLTIELQQELAVINDSTDGILGSGGLNTDVRSRGETIATSASRLLETIDQVASQHANRLQADGPTEHILGNDLLNVLHENIAEKFQMDIQVGYDEDVWLNMNSYTTIRGVMYLLGQLKNHLEVLAVSVDMRTEGNDAYLTVKWEGPAISVKTIEGWKECPLMVQAKGQGPVSLKNLLVEQGGDISSARKEDDETVSVKFKMSVVRPDSTVLIRSKKEHRPVYYEFDLFDRTESSSEFDNLKLSYLTYVVFDTETTGLDPSGGDEIISLAAVRIIHGRILHDETFDEMVDPRRNIPLESLKIHEIYPEMLKGKPLITEVLPRFQDFVEGAVLVAHNAAFDMKFLEMKEDAAGVKFTQPVLDTLLLSAAIHPHQELHNLEDIADRFGLPILGRHTALGDSILTAEALLKIIPVLDSLGIQTLKQAREASAKTKYNKIKF